VVLLVISPFRYVGVNPESFLKLKVGTTSSGLGSVCIFSETNIRN